MKTLLFTLSLAVAGVGSTYAQSSTVARGAVVGSIAGALIGGHNHDRWSEGAVIGAAAGALIVLLFPLAQCSRSTLPRSISVPMSTCRQYLHSSYVLRPSLLFR